MRNGADVIYQAALRTGHWYGRADFLQRVDQPSSLGGWSYEVLDAKLARDTRADTSLQLCLYSSLVGEIQGDLPERMHVILPGQDFQPLSFRVHDFLAYHRLVQRQLETAVDGAAEGATTYLYRGIATRAFERRFSLADRVKVVEATLVDGVLQVDLERELPETMKPRRIVVEGKKLIEDKKAA